MKSSLPARSKKPKMLSPPHLITMKNNQRKKPMKRPKKRKPKMNRLKRRTKRKLKKILLTSIAVPGMNNFSNLPKNPSTSLL